MSILLFLSDVAVIVYATFAILLWRETKKSADAAIKNATSAEANAESARKTLDAMVEANRINREALQLVQRAYITFPITGLDSERLVEPRSKKIIGWRFYVPVENTGNTPARELRIHANCIWQPGELPPGYEYPDFGPDEMFRFPLSAKERIFSARMEVDREIIEKLAAGEMNVYFYGWATYRDIFKGTEIHRTAFCHKARLLQAGEDLRLELMFYGDYNYQE